MVPGYTIDADDGPDKDESWTLQQIVDANEPAVFDAEDLERIKALEVGEKLTFGGGAWAQFTIKRAF